MKCPIRVLTLTTLLFLPCLATADIPVFTRSVTFVADASGNITISTTTQSGLANPDIWVNMSIAANRALYYRINMYPVGGPAACSVRVDSSVDGSTPVAGGVIAAQTCTSPATFTSTTATAFNFIRLNGVSLSANKSVSVTLTAFEVQPAASGTFGPILDCSLFPGANAGAKINSCIVALGVTGGVADARKLSGAQTISSDMFSGILGPVELRLGSGTYTVSATQNISNNNISIIGLGKQETFVSCTVNGDCFRAFTNPASGNEAGIIARLAFLGDGSANGVGVHVSGITSLTFDQVQFSNFTGANGIGLWLDNGAAFADAASNFTERTTILSSWFNNNKTGIAQTSQAAATSTSFFYSKFLDVRFNVNSGQTGWLVGGGALGSELFNSIVNMHFNCFNGATMISFTSNANADGNMFDVVGETTSGAACVGVNNAGSLNGYGLMKFDGGTTISNTGTFVLRGPSVVSAGASPTILSPFGGVAGANGFFFDGTNVILRSSNNGAGGIFLQDQSGAHTHLFIQNSDSLVHTYGNLPTAGWGFPAIYGAGRQTAQTSAVTLASYTVGAADGSFEIGANVNVTTATTFNFNVVCTYTDETSTVRTLLMQFNLTNGSTTVALTDANGAIPYHSEVTHIRAKASTTITIKSVGTFTAVTYNGEGLIKQIS